MTYKKLCELFGEPYSKDGKQAAMHKLGNRLRERQWTLAGRDLIYRGFSIKRDEVVFALIKSIEIGHCSCQSYFICVDEAIDCISGKLDSLLRFNPTDTIAESSSKLQAQD